MDNQTLRDRFRYQLTNLHALTVLTISILEIIGYAILIVAGVEFLSLQNHYLWYGVVLPIVANAITHLVARSLVNKPEGSRQQKNRIIITATLVTSFIVAIIHKEYIVTSCAFIFPIVLSALFNDRKLLNISFITSILILLTVGIAFWLDRSITLVTSINLFILLGFSFIAYLSGIISINFSKQNFMTIESQAAQNDKLQQDVLRDQMTGLYNHTAFVKQLEARIHSFDRQHPLCIAMIDIDNFKQINDTYGHDCGDIALVQLAKTIVKYCSSEDSAYRYGGEEFAILFSGKNAAMSQAALEKILADFRGHTFVFTSQPITFSAGIAEYAAGMTKDEFFEKADKTLYRAKGEGKNRVLAAENPL